MQHFTLYGAGRIYGTGLSLRVLFYDGLENITGPSVWLQMFMKGRGPMSGPFQPAPEFQLPGEKKMDSAGHYSPPNPWRWRRGDTDAVPPYCFGQSHHGLGIPAV